MIPPKLKIGHHVRIISPPGNGELEEDNKAAAISALEAIGLNTSFSTVNNGEANSYIHEINEAILDSEIHGLLLGTHINEANNFQKIDCDAIKTKPKVIAGLAESSLLSLYLYNETGVVNYFGPNLNLLGKSKSLDQCVRAMKEMLMINATIRIYPSSHYGIGNYQNRKSEIWVINEGVAEGKCMISGNWLDNFSDIDLLSSLDYNNNIIFIPGNQVNDISELHKNLDLIVKINGGNNINGLIIGAIEDNGITFKQVGDLIKKKFKLINIPIVANVNLFKSDPKFTLPIGGSIRMKIKGRNQVKIDITEH